MSLDKLKVWFIVKILRREIGNLRKEGNVSTASKVLKFLDGWKLMIGVAVLFGSKVFDAMHNGHSGDIVGSILSVLGWLPTTIDAQAIGVAAAGGLTLWGFFAKLYKAQKQLQAGTSASGLLSTEGYVNTYITTGKQ